MLLRMASLSDAALAEREMENSLRAWEGGTVASGDGWFHREGSIAWFWSELPIAFLNEVVPCGPDVSPAAVDRAVGELRGTGDPFIARIRAGLDDALVPQLERLGLREDPDEALPGMALHPLEGAALAGPDPDRLVIRTIHDVDGLAQLQALMAEGFEMPLQVVRRMMPPAMLPVPAATFVVGSVDGEPVTTATGWTEGDTVGVYNVATSAAGRRRGYGDAATRAVLRDGVARGASVGILQSSPLGHRVYERIGFREVVRYRVFASAP
jgi:ribosomal protein S18 acetylase RimI-like enzyme